METTIKVGDKTFKPYISQKEIETKIVSLAEKINADYKDKELIILSILNGSFIFTADLVRHLQSDIQVEFVKLSSYEGLYSTGNIQEILGLTIEISNKNILIVEDIIDTGQTLKRMLEIVATKNPKSVSMATLIFKKTAFKEQYQIDYTGFEIEDKFIVGYGLDYNGLGRQLNAIYQIV